MIYSDTSEQGTPNLHSLTSNGKIINFLVFLNVFQYARKGDTI